MHVARKGGLFSPDRHNESQTSNSRLGMCRETYKGATAAYSPRKRISEINPVMSKSAWYKDKAYASATSDEEGAYTIDNNQVLQ